MTVAPAWNTLVELITRAHAMYPDRIAVTDDRGSLTYRDCQDRSLRVATWMSRQGVRPGDRVLLLTGNRSEYLVVEQAAALGGFVKVAVADRLHPTEVIRIAEDAEPAVAFIEASWLAGAGPTFRDQLVCPIVVIGSGDLEQGRPEDDGYLFEDVLDQTPTPERFEIPGPEDMAWILYTSGSTGTPKGVVHCHRSIGGMVRGTLLSMGDVREDDVALHTAPLPHVSGVVAMVMTAVGAENRLLDKFDPASLFDAVEQHAVTVVPVVPTQLRRLTDYLLGSAPRELSSIRVLPYAGSAIAPDRLAAAREFFGGALVQFYGASESPMPVATLFPADHTAAVNDLGLPRFAAAGRITPGLVVQIRDSTGACVPPGERGEVVVLHPAACQGYWRNADATAELIDDDGFIHTGDIGVVDEHGYLFIVDRKKEMIVSGGFNVFPREVENALSTMPEIADVAVVSAPDERWGEAVVAVVVPRAGCLPTLEQVQAHVRRTLAGYKIPRRLEVLDELPKNGNGKVAKNVLTEGFWAGASRKVGG